MNICNMKLIYSIILLCGLSINVQAKTLTIAIDLSGSNPLLQHKNFAYESAKYMSEQITKLKTGDSVSLQTFGSRGDASNLLNYKFTLSRRLRASAIATKIAKFIQSLPKRKDLAQSSTNLIAWLEFTGGFDCKNQGQIIVITDGLESSSYVDARKFLDGKAKFPKPDVDLKGCNLTFYGLGAGLPAPYVKIIRNAWRKWVAASGASFTAVIR